MYKIHITQSLRLDFYIMAHFFLFFRANFGQQFAGDIEIWKFVLALKRQLSNLSKQKQFEKLLNCIQYIKQFFFHCLEVRNLHIPTSNKYEQLMGVKSM